MPDSRAARAVSVYIALNPVRAGLCGHPAAWESGSYAAHALTAEPRAHLSTDYTATLFGRTASTLVLASEVALDAARGGRPGLAELLPDLQRVTRAHVRHANEVFGYGPDEIARYYGVSARTLRRCLAA